jgi:hypothetical protein
MLPDECTIYHVCTPYIEERYSVYRTLDGYNTVILCTDKFVYSIIIQHFVSGAYIDYTPPQ